MVKRFGVGDDYYMHQALVQAKRAAEHDEVPIGAVIVNAEGNIVGRGYNKVEELQCQLAHAELRALSQACKKNGDWRLNGHWLYVTLEPCSMCMYALRTSRIEGIVYGAESPLFGYHLDSGDSLAVYKKTNVIKGVLAEESASILKQFFQKKRVKK
jgi:tRNA(adenine34) deaminase